MKLGCEDNYLEGSVLRNLIMAEQANKNMLREWTRNKMAKKIKIWLFEIQELVSPWVLEKSLFCLVDPLNFNLIIFCRSNLLN